MPPRNVVPEAGAEAASAGVGGGEPARDDPPRRRSTGSARSRSRSSIPKKRVHWITDYYTTLAAECVPIGDAVNPNVACVTTFMCHEDEDEAMRRGLEGANFFGYSLAHYYVFGDHRPGATDVWAEYQQTRAQRGYAPEAVEAASDGG